MFWEIFSSCLYRPDCFGSFRTSSVCFGCFDIGSKHRNKPKIFLCWFHETNRNKRETDLVSVCFGSNRNFFLFISRTPYSIMAWFCLFRVKLILRHYSNLSCICTAIDGLVYGCHRLENRSVRYHIISYALTHRLWAPWTGPNCKDTKP